MRFLVHPPDRSDAGTLRRVEAGLYETQDGRYGVVKVESADEWDGVTQDGWAITEERRPGLGDAAKDGEELPGYHRTKAEAVEALVELLARQG